MADAVGRAPVSGGWHEGDPAGWRRFADIGPMRLENGSTLPAVRLAYETWGRLAPDRSNAVLVLHAFTGDAHASGPAGPGQPQPGWWSTIVGPGRALDTRRWFVVAPNVLGGCGGSTGPSSPAPDGRAWGSRFPVVSTRDQVEAEARLADRLGIATWSLVIGPSMGGNRALEWAVAHPARVGGLVVVASGALTTAEQAAWLHAQVRAIEWDPAWRGGDYYDEARGPVRGLDVARQIAHITYRSPLELDQRFGRLPQHQEDVLRGGRLAVQSYLDHHGLKLARRFDAGSYVALARAMLTHDVGRDRGGVEQALGQVQAPTLVVAVDSDRLYYPRECLRLAHAIPGALYREIHSLHGHDGFLIESDQLAVLLGDFLSRAVRIGARRA